MEWLQFVQWGGLLIVSLYVLVKGANLFLDNAKVIGQSFGLNTFVIGVLIVGFGTSLPELAASLAAVLNGASELVVANVVGSNITNILLIIGCMALLTGKLIIKQDLLRTELPLFVISQFLLLAVIFDGQVTALEALFLLGIFGSYLWSVVVEAKHGLKSPATRPKLKPMALVTMLLGLAALLVGAHYTVTTAANIATALAVPISLVSMTAIAIGTSLPELMIGIQSIRRGEFDLAMGNIFGTNIFNALMVAGAPALIATLTVDKIVLDLGIWFMLLASLILFVLGLSQRVMRWEGLALIILFVYFLTNLANFL